ncbi:8f58518c-5c24-4bd8-995a-8c3fd196d446 [Sclerotinia trifoliorum]|uniref:8f58518c-5c24-4bd8-995a-8c3fd196d446 n=1 Tax=Sclerotinia trifoliorum TaxID=28548 RepID=A0A8H2ZRX8_9HELO|nr:8f58518c-5c24-4bd8-995a-8c3fd196d446 [Sclerotinia trifoliorum]
MQPLTLMILFLASTSFAVITTTPARRAAVARVASPKRLTPANPPTAFDVKNSLGNWATSVNTVNAYLDDPNNSTKLKTAIAFARDEPVQLATLMKTPNLSPAGIKSAKVLMANFPSIVSNLQNVYTGVMTTQDATMAVNFNRCCTVLPNIGSLWAAATNATKLKDTPPPNLEAQCGMMSCNVGISGVQAQAQAASNVTGSVMASRVPRAKLR